MLDKDKYGMGFSKMVVTVILGAVVLGVKNSFGSLRRKMSKGVDRFD